MISIIPVLCAASLMANVNNGNIPFVFITQQHHSQRDVVLVQHGVSDSEREQTDCRNDCRSHP